MSEPAAVWGEGSSDAELITAARGGDSGAFGALYERHAGAARVVARQYTRSSADAEDVVGDAFAKVYAIVRGGGGPDVAFRAYLFTVVRRLAHHRSDSAQRVQPTDDIATFEAAFGHVSGVDDPALADFERGVVAKAYSSLPERWQAVLWYTEIERLAAAQIAPLLGLTANGVAALAYRAREGLREAYLQQHLVSAPTGSCRAINGKLGAYVRGGLARRETAQVREHLETCADCRNLVLELGDVNHGLRGIIAPLVLGVAGLAALASPLPVGVLGAAAATAAAGGTAAGTAAGAGTTAAAAGGTATTVGSGVTSGTVAAGAGASGAATSAAATGASLAGSTVAGSTVAGSTVAGTSAVGAATGAATTGAGLTAAGTAAGTTAAAGTAAGSAVAAGGLGASAAGAGTLGAGAAAGGMGGSAAAAALGAGAGAAGALSGASAAGAALVGSAGAAAGAGAAGAAVGAGALAGAGATAMTGAGVGAGVLAGGGLGGLIAALPGGVAGAVTVGVVGVSLAVGGALVEPGQGAPATSSAQAPVAPTPTDGAGGGPSGSVSGQPDSGGLPGLDAPLVLDPPAPNPAPVPSPGAGPDPAPQPGPDPQPTPATPELPPALEPLPATPPAAGPVDPQPEPSPAPTPAVLTVAGTGVVLVPGSAVPVPVTVTNTGQASATDLRAAFVLPAGASLDTGALADGWAPCADGPATGTELCLPALAGAASSVVAPAVRLDDGATLEPGAAVAVRVSGAGLGVAEHAIPVTVEVVPAELVVTTGGTVRLVAGQPLPVTFTVANAGGVAAQGVVASVTLPAGVTWVGSAGGSAPWSCTLVGDTVGCRLDELPVLSSVDLVLDVVAGESAVGVPGLQAPVVVSADAGVAPASASLLIEVGAPTPAEGGDEVVAEPPA